MLTPSTATGARFEIEYPAGLGIEVVGLVSSMLRSKPMERMGCLSGGAHDVKSHPFFGAIDWERLHRRISHSVDWIRARPCPTVAQMAAPVVLTGL